MEDKVEIRLFGGFRQYAGNGQAREAVMYLPAAVTGTVGQVLAHVGIDPAQVGNVFLNGRLLPRSNYPILLGYPLAAESRLSPDEVLDAPVRPGDRVGIFPLNMGAVVV